MRTMRRMTSVGVPGFGTIAVILGALLAAEVLLLSINDWSWRVVYAPFSAGFGLARWIYGYVGPVILPLGVLAGIYVYITTRLALARLRSVDIKNRTRYYRAMTIVEYAQAFGFLGTAIALIQVMQNLDTSKEQITLVQTMMNESSKAFGSTIAGITVSAAAYITRQAFGLNEGDEK